eukprot:15354783-Ditylum_brightwellii.AAC.1
MSIYILESRDRVGGRLLNATFSTSPHPRHSSYDGKPVDSNDSKNSIDLGASWIWPESNPNMDQLAKKLDVEKISEGDGAFRFKDGSQTIALKLAEKLCSNENVKIMLQCSVYSILDSLNKKASNNKKVEIMFSNKSSPEGVERNESMEADAVFIACPPRLTIEKISFQPSLDERMINAMKSCRTWMAQQGKFIAVYGSAFWRKNRQRKLYWERVSVDGPLDMIFDNNDRIIWGFLSNEERWRSLKPRERQHQALLQIQAIMGGEQEAMSPKAVFEMDWSNEKSTCSELDAIEPYPWQHPIYRDRDLFELGRWNSTLWFIGSETGSKHSAGFMEGAVESALSRVQKYLDVTFSP